MTTAARIKALGAVLQDVLAEHDWAGLLTFEDSHGLTPLLFWQHVPPHGEVTLDMTARLTIRTAGPRISDAVGAPQEDRPADAAAVSLEGRQTAPRRRTRRR
jgi:hypothetical protein